MLATAIRAGLNATDLTELELCYAPPFGSAKDPVNFVGYVIENTLTGKVKQFLLGRCGQTAPGWQRHAAGCAHPFRAGAQAISKASSTSRWMSCANAIQRSTPKSRSTSTAIAGLRSYLACRMLTGCGYDCYNLSGGWRFYELAANDRQTPEHGCYDPK